MPMLSACLTNDRVSRVDLSRLSTFVTDPAATHLDFEDLTSFMGVPVSAGARREEDVVEHYFVGIGA